MGRSLKTNLFNLGINEIAEQVMAKYGVKLTNLYELEPDAGLGNGGLGRLAACYPRRDGHHRPARYRLFHPL